MRSRAQVALSVLTLIAFLNNCKVQASDGCGGGTWRCGDICISLNKPCHCGDDKILVHFKVNECTQRWIQSYIGSKYRL